ncbi:MAG: AzlD domain-containing protein [Eubacteriaceae bacterium]|nr:AzlD domain-containing protein [Eubacteriaceae bacterium]
METTIKYSIIIGLAALATQITRWAPFILLSKAKGSFAFLQYLGKVVPSAAIGLLVVYCLRDLDFSAQASRSIAAATSAALTAAIQAAKGKTPFSIAAGTLAYMLLIRLV